MTQRPAVIITGGAKRVGAVLTRHFAGHGYDIALHYHQSKSEAESLQKEILSLGVSCQLFQHDLNDIAGLSSLVASIYKAMPHVNALVNNASLFERATLMDTSEALFDRQFTTNFKAPFFLTQAFSLHVGKGSIVNILDTDIVQTQGSHFAYLLSKKILAECTVMAARELGPDIRVNAVCPGCLIPADAADEAYVEKLKDTIPLKEHPLPQEAAEAVLWLVKQPHITGQLIYVDGGKHVL